MTDLEPTIIINEDKPTITITDGNSGDTVTVQPLDADIEVIDVGEMGPVGPQGPQGLIGPQGLQGSPGPAGPPGGSFIEYDQLIAANVWHINHNLNGYPVVNVVDSAGSPEFGDISYVDANNLTLTFTNAFAGKAYLIL